MVASKSRSESLLLKIGSWLESSHEPTDLSVHVWDWKAGIAFWATMFGMQGAALFLIGSVAMYPGLLAGRRMEAWVDYPFMWGAWCFSVSNYLVYFQAINKFHEHDFHDDGGDRADKRLRFFALPKDQGQYASFLNCTGAVLFNFNTMSMFVDKSGYWSYTLWYVATGAGGSAFFTIGAMVEGEYNGWRSPSKEFLKRLPVWQSLCNLLGGINYFIAYASAFNHWADPETLEITFVVAPFIFGSVFYLAGSWLDVVMWKKQLFGLGFAKELVDSTQACRQSPHTDNPLQPCGKVCPVQMIALAIYATNLCMAWCQLSHVLAGTREGGDRIVFTAWVGRIFVTYFGILWLMTVLHRTPAQKPYNYLLLTMRVAGFLDMLVQFFILNKNAVEVDVDLSRQ